MSEKDSKYAFSAYADGQKQFDYFVCGVAGALFAYIAQTYIPKPLAFAPQTIEPLALVLLATAFFLGIKRIESTIIVMRWNHEMLDNAEKAGNMTEAIFKARREPGFNPHSGHVISPEDLPAKRQQYMLQSQWSEEALQKAAAISERYYRYRNLFLQAGFAAIALAKILSPYA